MNDKDLEFLQNFEIKDNDEEDDKMEEKEINAQLNIIPENNLQNKNTLEKNNENADNNINLEGELNINEIGNDNNGLPNIKEKSIFENPYLQTSYNLFTKLRRIIIRKENLTKINYFDKWQKIAKENNALIQNRNVIQNILNNSEENIENKSYNEIITEHQNQLLKSGNQNFQALINPFTSINDMNFENDYIDKKNDYQEKLIKSNLPKEKRILILALTNILENKLSNYFKKIIINLKFKIIIINYQDKLFQMDRLNKKYETILDEKSSIIINKTDEIEDLKEKLENLSNNLKEALKKQRALNIIPESLCSKCGRSLEESFCGDSNNNENQKIIKEQNELIETMKKEMNDLRNKYNYSEMRLKDLDEIKKEFADLSGALLKPKSDNSSQTEMDTAFNSGSSFISNYSNENANLKVNKNNARKEGNNNYNKNNQYKNKFSNLKKELNQQKKVTNYNIININNTNSNNSITNEGILSAELLNLNREFNRLKNENKIMNDKNNKFEKEKKDILDKLKTKNELCEKLKNENAELIVLINNSRYKNTIEIENENKKLKMTLEQIDNEIKNMNIINEKNGLKIKEQNNQIEKMKSIIQTYDSFKIQKDNLLLMNTKYESEIKKLKYELEQIGNNFEKTKIMLQNSEQKNENLSKEISYYNLHINKYKEDAAKALEDAVEYQKIVQTLQNQINEYKIALNKLKQNKKYK